MKKWLLFIVLVLFALFVSPAFAECEKMDKMCYSDSDCCEDYQLCAKDYLSEFSFCRAIKLELIPNSVYTNDKFNARVITGGNYSGIAYICSPAYVDCWGLPQYRKGSCISFGDGCQVTLSAPSTMGTYSYAATLVNAPSGLGSNVASLIVRKRGGGGVGCGLRGCLMMAIGPYILEIDPIPTVSFIVLVVIEIFVLAMIVKKLHITSKKKR